MAKAYELLEWFGMSEEEFNSAVGKELDFTQLIGELDESGLGGLVRETKSGDSHHRHPGATSWGARAEAGTNQTSPPLLTYRRGGVGGRESGARGANSPAAATQER